MWIAASLLFGLYAEGFSNYGKTYGSLAGVIVLIFWLYLSSIAVPLGRVERRVGTAGFRVLLTRVRPHRSAVPPPVAEWTLDDH